MIIDLLDLFHTGNIDLHGSLGLPDAVKGKDHVIGGEARTIVKLHVLAQVKAPGCGVDRLPACRKTCFDAVVPVVANKAFVGMTNNVVGSRMILRMRVKRQDVVLCSPFQVRSLRQTQPEHEGARKDDDFS